VSDRDSHSAALRRWRDLAALACVLTAITCRGEGAATEGNDAAIVERDRLPAPADAPLVLRDVASPLGLDFVHETGAFGRKWMPETLGSGGGFLDYDGDGWPDIFLVNGSPWPGRAAGAERTSKQRLYRNLSGTGFADVTEEAGLDLSLYGMGATFADYDGDRDIDVYITGVGDSRLLRNDGGRFTDVSTSAGVLGTSDGGSQGWSTCATWLDADRDGRLDLFVCNYVRWSPDTDLQHTLDGVTKAYATPQPYQGQSNRFFRNVDGRRFADVTEDAGLHNPDGKSLGVVVDDFNDDGWPDLFVANDTESNFLYMNDGDGSFTDIALRAGVGYDELGRARAGMGTDVADLAGEGRLSIAIGNYSGEPISLYTQVETDLYRDVAGTAGLAGRTLLPLTFGLRFVDLDLDGDQDLVLANGHLEPGINAVQDNVTFAQRPQLMLNDGHGRFSEVSRVVGADFQEPVVGRGLATADVDRDGDFDVLLTVNGGRPRLFRNDLSLNDHNWIRLRLHEDSPNWNAVGAKILVFSGDLAQRQIVRTGSSYLAQSELSAVTFGLGARTRVDSVLVRWPTSGAVTRHGPFTPGAEYAIESSGGGSELSPVSDSHREGP
jgi:hypothetical protein